jgi:hypothetical protein
MEIGTPGFLVDVPLIILQDLHFTHDGTPARFSLIIHRYLHHLQVDQLPGPPRLPVFNQLDFYVRGL